MKGEAFSTTGQLLGTVLAVQANFYRVQLDLGGLETRRLGDKETWRTRRTRRILPPLPSSHPPTILPSSSALVERG